jgi:hypothetical protein
MSEPANLAAIATALLAGSVMLLRSRRRHAGVAHEPIANRGSVPVSQPTDHACSAYGCGETTTWACTYRNPTGQRCGSHWCKTHVSVVGNGTYCTRHAGVSKTLNQTEGSIYEVKSQPSLEDRALSLLDLIRQKIDPELRSALARAAVELPGAQVAGQKSVQEIQSGSERIGWQVSWGLYTNRGYLLRTMVRVGVPEPPVVQAFVSNDVVFEAVPYWITRRLNGEPATGSDHQRFFADLLRAVQAAVPQAVAQASAQHEFESEKFGSKKTARY